ncbi:hypothetical protein COCSUDRAFT_55845 [Coccomyxa subellipsoidea C-169]|uniref:Uncharacterized protein n=1 Tax=Coccomyxa subellipsoidea (strain C-169) TaxID=574566 RepID=I0YUS8_COCSC|nr:hypothetical protein COCSUDRAFT_55845 [Coccomyxa subellipsoidea C-169]EIE22147.1 hypothetical protein COCSUDRAFT_55845 [Coccomyxa subellipsoidea C-169]|eukprot:XP_005646691.1 hypothetical protein COCSUDRAFT_55845 [Coccomyxa subellipsoidea C-169]
MVAPSGLRAVAVGAPSNFRVFPEADGGHAVVGGRLGVHVPEKDVERRLPSDDVMKYYADVGVTIVNMSTEAPLHVLVFSYVHAKAPTDNSMSAIRFRKHPEIAGRSSCNRA